MQSALTAIAAMALVMATPAAADPENGRRLAERWCASCHVVSSVQQGGSTDAPPFSAVAQKYSEAGPLTAFLTAPYPRMPAMALTREEIADLVAYIRTLGPPRPEPAPAPEKDKGPDLPTRG